MTDAGPPLDADALRALEDRLDRATRAAERLLGEAAARGASAAGHDGCAPGEVPPGGWQRRDRRAGSPAGGPWLNGADSERLIAVLTGVLERIPVELEQRLMAALHELLLAIRALVDWGLERAQRRQAPGAEVQDIPIL